MTLLDNHLLSHQHSFSLQNALALFIILRRQAKYNLLLGIFIFSEFRAFLVKLEWFRPFKKVDKLKIAFFSANFWKFDKNFIEIEALKQSTSRHFESFFDFNSNFYFEWPLNLCILHIFRRLNCNSIETSNLPVIPIQCWTKKKSS